jgi:hypothetical protein
VLFYATNAVAVIVVGLLVGPIPGHLVIVADLRALGGGGRSSNALLGSELLSRLGGLDAPHLALLPALFRRVQRLQAIAHNGGKLRP